MSLWESLTIIVIALIVLGPQQLLCIAQKAGKLFSTLKKTSQEIQQQILNSSEQAPLKEREEKAKKADDFYQNKSS